METLNMTDLANKLGAAMMTAQAQSAPKGQLPAGPWTHGEMTKIEGSKFVLDGKIVQADARRGGYHVSTPTHRYLIYVDCEGLSDEAALATVRAVTAVPELIEALRSMLDAYHEDPGSAQGAGQSAAAERAYEALAKATGGR